MKEHSLRRATGPFLPLKEADKVLIIPQNTTVKINTP